VSAPDSTPLGLGLFFVYTQGRRSCVAPTLGWMIERRWRSKTARDPRAGRPTNRAIRDLRDAGGEAAVDGDGVAGDVVVFDEHEDGVGDLGGRAFAWRGIRTSRLSFFCSALMCSWNFVRMTPGATQLTRMLSLASSRARARVSWGARP